MPLIMLLWTLCASFAHATTISYTATQIDINRWQYDYAIENNTLGTGLRQFTIFFQEGLFSNLTNESSLGEDWDLILIQPDLAIPAAGFIDGLSAGSGLSAGASLTGLSVSFDYFAPGVPGSQRFSIVDPTSFVELEGGNTIMANTIPVASTFSLVALALFVAVASARRQGAAN